MYNGIALDTPLGDSMYQGKEVSGQRRCDLALLERQCAVAFPLTPTLVPTFCSTLHNCRGSDTHPCHQESQSALLGRAKGKFGIKIPKFGIKNSSVDFYILSLSDTA